MFRFLQGVRGFAGEVDVVWRKGTLLYTCVMDVRWVYTCSSSCEVACFQHECGGVVVLDGFRLRQRSVVVLRCGVVWWW
jgi:hypothetical protein